MSMFDSIIGEAGEKFNLGGKTGTLLSALLAMMTNKSGGGFGGFLEKFNQAGLGDTVASWIGSGSNTPVSNEQLESALGADTIQNIADQAGTDYDTTASATAYMTPRVVDALTPDGVVPQDGDLLSRIGGYLTGGIGGAALGGLGTAAAMTGGIPDKVGATVGDAFDATKNTVGGGINAVGDTAGKVGDKFGSAMNSVSDRLDGDGDGGGGSMLKWLLPLLLLGLLAALGYMFCGKSTPVVTTNSNVNANGNKAVVTNGNSTAKAVDSSFSIKADNGKYVVTGVVPDEATKKQIMDALTAQYGAGNVDFAGLKVDAAAKPFGAGWWDNFSKMLPNMKDWKTGELSFVGSAITVANGLPAAALAQLKSLFVTGWTLPVSVAGVENAAKQANEEALKELNSAGTVAEVVKALNVSIINFASGKSDIPADAKPILEKAAEVLKKQPAGTTVEIGGYTDNKGNPAANKTLSQSRADSVKKALVGLGVGDAMLKSVGYGDANPVGDNNTEDGRFKNRRIEYKTGTGGAPTATTTTTNTNAAK